MGTKMQRQICDKKDLRRVTKPQKQGERLRVMNRDRVRVNERMKRIKMRSRRQRKKSLRFKSVRGADRNREHERRTSTY